jgi:hypothetical protein
MDHPYVFCRLETKSGIFEATDYSVHSERQRPTLLTLTLSEPIEKDVGCILQMGYLGRAYRMTVLKVLSCFEVAPETFDVVAIEPVRQILDAEYLGQLQGADLVSALKSITALFGFKLKFGGAVPVTKPKNMIFMGSIRNALDQIWEVFELKHQRWAIPLLKEEFHFLANGKFEIEPQEIPMDYFRQETDGGIELNIVPMYRPYTPVIWRGTEEIIDIARINSLTRSMFITFADKAA